MAPVGLRQPFAELQRAACDHAGNSLSGLVDVGRGQRRRPARALAQFSGHRSMVPSGVSCQISCSPGEWSADRGEHEHRDLPVGLLLVLGVVGPGRDRALPPRGLLVAEDLARLVVLGDRAVLQLDARVRLDVVVPDRMLRRAAQRCDHRVLAVVLHPHQRGLADLAALGADGGQQDDGLALQLGALGAAGLHVLLGVVAGPVGRAGFVFSGKWHDTSLGRLGNRSPDPVFRLAEICLRAIVKP